MWQCLEMLKFQKIKRKTNIKNIWHVKLKGSLINLLTFLWYKQWLFFIDFFVCISPQMISAIYLCCSILAILYIETHNKFTKQKQKNWYCKIKNMTYLQNKPNYTHWDSSQTVIPHHHHQTLHLHLTPAQISQTNNSTAV